jgi:ribosomal protein S18 acetylase RimI-like enzyme
VEAVTVRTFSPADKAACLKVFDSNRPTYFSAAERPQFSAFLDRLPGPYLVLEDPGGQVVACGGFAVEAGTAQASFCWGMVEQPRHGQGLGRRLALERLQLIRQDPRVQRVRLDTSQHTAGFYERLGFAVTEVRRDGYQPGLHRCEMEWIINRAATDRGAPGEAS